MRLNLQLSLKENSDFSTCHQISIFVKLVSLEREESSTSGSAASAPGCNFTSTNETVNPRSDMKRSKSIPKWWLVIFTYLCHMGISINGGTPSHHPFIDGILPLKIINPIQLLGYPPWRAGNPHIYPQCHHHLEAPAIPPWCCPEPTRRCPRMPRVGWSPPDIVWDPLASHRCIFVQCIISNMSIYIYIHVYTYIHKYVL